MKIMKSVVKELISHAKKDAPVEACGYLAARDGVATHAYRLTNTDRSNEHFSFDPKEQFAALKDARLRGLELCGVYHSHPASPARPSEEDKRLSQDPTMEYVIISLVSGKEDVRAFRIARAGMEPVLLEVIEDEGV